MPTQSVAASHGRAVLRREDSIFCTLRSNDASSAMFSGVCSEDMARVRRIRSWPVSTNACSFLMTEDGFQ